MNTTLLEVRGSAVRPHSGQSVRRREPPLETTRALSLRLLGPMEVFRDRAALALPQSRKTRALLAYLAVTGRAHRRDRLCTMFWDVPDDPRGALRWSLSKLRALVDEPDRQRLLASREDVAFDDPTTDVDRLAVAKLARSAVGGASTCQLATAAEAYRGEFLEGLDLPNCPEFQAWCVAERDEANRHHAAILKALVDRLVMEPEAALPHARQLVDLDPYDVPPRLALVRLMSVLGRRAEAEQQLAAGRRLFKELDTDVIELETAARDLDDWLARRPIRLAEADEPPSAPPEVQTAVARSDHPPHQVIRFCTAPDGVRIAYATAGEGLPLVQTANWVNHLEFDWESPVRRKLAEGLARDHLLVRYDQRGNGLSDWEAEDISLDAFVRDLEAVVDAMKLDRIALFGLSQGCAAAIAFAVRHPGRVSRMVLHGGYARGWRKRGIAGEAERREALVTLTRTGWTLDNPAFHQVFTSLYMPDGTPEQMQSWNELQRTCVSPENAARLQQACGDIDVSSLLAKVDVPTLVLHARGDAVVPFECGRELAMAIPDARLVPLDSRNHLILDHEPAWERFRSEIEEFLSGETLP